MKMAPIIRSMNKHSHKMKHLLVHTGQHYDQKMSKSFFEDLGMPRPDIDLGVGSGSHAEQTARIMIEFEKVCLREKPNLVVVVGDVNSTMACAITAKKMMIKVAHVEAGLRSRDMTMPEEINRLCTDILCDYLFTTDHFADENLRAEGIPEGRIHFVGNVMIDSLLTHMEEAKKNGTCEKLGLRPGNYATITIHRPSNVDDRQRLAGILEALQEIAVDIPLLFPMHPRTKKMLQLFELQDYVPPIGEAAIGKLEKGLWSTEPLGYLDFLNLNMNAKFVLTDSGGLQEETTVLGVPCVTIRNNTERPITCEVGTNMVIGNNKGKILEIVKKVMSEERRKGAVPEKWDGKAADRIVEVLLRSFNE